MIMASKRMGRAKAIAALAAALAAFGGLAGCRGDAADDPVPAWDRMHRFEGREVEVALELGFDEEDLARMEREGSELGEWEVIMYATALIEHLEEKYGLSFRAIKLLRPSYAHASYHLDAAVSGGAFDGVEFSCRWVFADPQSTYYEDNLLACARVDDVADWCGEVAERELGRYGVVCRIRGISTLRYRRDGGAEELSLPASEVSELIGLGIDIYFPPDDGLDEEGYRAAVDGLYAAFRDEAPGSQVWITAYQVLTIFDEYADEGFTADSAFSSTQGSRAEPGVTYDWPVGEWPSDGRVCEWGGPSASKKEG